MDSDHDGAGANGCILRPGAVDASLVNRPDPRITSHRTPASPTTSLPPTRSAAQHDQALD